MNGLLAQACCDWIEDGLPVHEILYPHYDFEVTWQRCTDLQPPLDSQPSDVLVEMAAAIFLCWALVDLEQTGLHQLESVIALYKEYSGFELGGRTCITPEEQSGILETFIQECILLKNKHKFRGGVYIKGYRRTQTPRFRPVKVGEYFLGEEEGMRRRLLFLSILESGREVEIQLD